MRQMRIFRQHVPGFIDAEPVTFTFHDTEDLLAQRVVKQWAEDRQGNPIADAHFVLHGTTLMGVKDDGFWWWVIGYINTLDGIELPQWKGGRYRCRMEDGSMQIFEADEVVSSTADHVWLRDGRKVSTWPEASRP